MIVTISDKHCSELVEYLRALTHFTLNFFFLWWKRSDEESAGQTWSKRHDKFVSFENFVKELQGCAKEWALGCVNSPPADGGSQEAGFCL